MFYPQYTIDYHGKSAILNSESRVIVCVDQLTGERKNLTPPEEIIVLCYFMTIEFNEERNGQDMGNYVSIEFPGISLENATDSIKKLQRDYGMAPLTIEQLAETREILHSLEDLNLEGSTRFPKDWNKLGRNEFNTFMHQWLDGKI